MGVVHCAPRPTDSAPTATAFPPVAVTHWCWTKPNSEGEGAEGKLAGEGIGIGYGWCNSTPHDGCWPACHFLSCFREENPSNSHSFSVDRRPAGLARDPKLHLQHSVAVASGSGGSQGAKEASSSDSLGRTGPAMTPQTCPAQAKFAPDPQRSRGALVVAASSFVSHGQPVGSGTHLWL